MFKDIRFPLGVRVQTTGGPAFDVDVLIKSNWQESRNLNADLERWQGECSQGAKLPEQYKPLQAFFRIVRGMAYTFRYRDPLDYEIDTSESAFEVIDGTHAYLAKLYSYQGETYTRRITKPVQGTYVASGGGSLDYSTGIITGALPSAFSCQFDLHVRFDTNEMTHRSIDRHPSLGLIVDWNDIPMREVVNEEDDE